MHRVDCFRLYRARESVQEREFAINAIEALYQTELRPRKRIVDFGSPNPDLQQGSAINDRKRARDATTELCAFGPATGSLDFRSG